MPQGGLNPYAELTRARLASPSQPLQETTMERLWTDGPPTRTMNPPPPPRPPFAQEPPPPPPPPPRGPSRWLAAVGGGTVSAVVVAAVPLRTGPVDNDAPSSAASTSPVS